MDLRDKRELNKGFGDGLSRAFELAVTPVVFALIGLGLDHLLGITPALTIVLAVLAVVGTFVKLWYGYDHEMRKHEEGKPWARPGHAAPAKGSSRG